MSPGLTLSCRAPAGHPHLGRGGVSDIPGAAGGRGAMGPLAELTACGLRGSLGPAVLHLHCREHTASSRPRPRRRGLEGLESCGKPVMVSL